MKPITRQRKEQLALEARGLCRYSGNHDQHVINGMCYECAIRHRKMRSPHIPDWWPLSIHYSERRYQEWFYASTVLGGALEEFTKRYDAIPEEIAYAIFRDGRISPLQLDLYLSRDDQPA